MSRNNTASDPWTNNGIPQADVWSATISTKWYKNSSPYFLHMAHRFELKTGQLSSRLITSLYQHRDLLSSTIGTEYPKESTVSGYSRLIFKISPAKMTNISRIIVNDFNFGPELVWILTNETDEKWWHNRHVHLYFGATPIAIPNVPCLGQH